MSIKFFGDYLVDSKTLTIDELNKAIDYQNKNNLPLGELALKESLLSLDDIIVVKSFQKIHNKKFGESALELKLLKPLELELLLKKQNEQNLMLGEILVLKNILSQEKLNDSFEQFYLLQKERIKHIFKELAFFDRNDLILDSISIFEKIYLRSTQESIKVEEIDFFPTLSSNYDGYIQNISGEENLSFILQVPNHLEDLQAKEIIESFAISIEDSFISNSVNVSKDKTKKININEIDIEGYCKIKFLTLQNELIFYIKI